ncbi:MAG: porin family protein [Alphaproteobacteria bacterium]|nr:porin family protein [Alphaproteobacteria bacterium]
MKKLLLTASTVALFAAFANPASAECNGIYGAIRGGAVKLDADHLQGNLDDTRMMISGALGYRYEYFRAELEYVWRKYNKDTQKAMGYKTMLKSYSYMLNGYYDILPYNWWTPYVGVGLGMTKTRYLDKNLNPVSVNEQWKKTKFTWSLGAGLSLKVTNRFNVDAGYRYYNFGKPGHEGVKYKVTAQEVYAGIRYVF